MNEKEKEKKNALTEEELENVTGGATRSREPAVIDVL